MPMYLVYVCVIQILNFHADEKVKLNGDSHEMDKVSRDDHQEVEVNGDSHEMDKVSRDDHQEVEVNGDHGHQKLHSNIEQKEVKEAMEQEGVTGGEDDEEERGKKFGQKRKREREHKGNEEESSEEPQGNNREVEEDERAEEEEPDVMGLTLGNHGVSRTPPKRQTGKERPGKCGLFLYLKNDGGAFQNYAVI